jgi:endonuclease YncB( thermonuclease family)
MTKRMACWQWRIRRTWVHNGIDCLEKGQEFGQKAKQATSALLFGKDVRIESYGRDKHRETLGTVSTVI